MNFKPLKNEIQYENTKRIIKEFEPHIDDLLKRYKDSKSFWLHAKMTIYMINILEAEVQDYEHRMIGDYQWKLKGRKGPKQ